MATTKRCPSGKRQFRDLEQAKKVITSARQKVEHGYQDSTYIPARAYKCPRCHRWHLTSERDMTPFPYDARRLVVRCLAMNGHAETPTQFVAGWNQPGYLPDSEPAAFDSIKDAALYLRDELDTEYERTNEGEGEARSFTPLRIREAIRSLDELSDRDTEWSSGEALAGFVYWIAPEVVAPE